MRGVCASERARRGAWAGGGRARPPPPVEGEIQRVEGDTERVQEELEADAVLAGLDAQVGHLGEVDEDGAVGGLHLVPAVLPVVERLAQRRQVLVGQPQRQHLTAAGEAERGAPGAGWGLGRIAHGEGCTNSVRTPPEAEGGRTATREPRMPVRAASSISRRPAARSSSSVAATSSTR